MDMIARVADGQLDRVKRFFGVCDQPVTKRKDAVRFAILGTGPVATYSLIWPAKRREDIEVVAVAARDHSRAAEFAKKNGIHRALDSYQAVLDDPEVDAVYIGLVNGLHGYWAQKALEAGKHVLCEKPFATNADETRAVYHTSKAKQLLCREAVHYRESPLAKHMKHLVESGAIGTIQHIQARLLMPWFLFDKDAPCFNFNLGGGALAYGGCYVAHITRFLSGQQPVVIGAAAKKLANEKVDAHMEATLTWGGRLKDATAKLEASLVYPTLFPITEVTVQGSKGMFQAHNFVMPVMGHLLKVVSTDEAGKQSEWRGAVYGSGESQYFYQLERFAEDLRRLKGDKADRKLALEAMRRDEEDAVGTAQLIDNIYDAAGLGARQPTIAWHLKPLLL